MTSVESWDRKHGSGIAGPFLSALAMVILSLGILVGHSGTIQKARACMHFWFLGHEATSNNIADDLVRLNVPASPACGHTQALLKEGNIVRDVALSLGIDVNHTQPNSARRIDPVKSARSRGSVNARSAPPPPPSPSPVGAAEAKAAEEPAASASTSGSEPSVEQVLVEEAVMSASGGESEA